MPQGQPLSPMSQGNLAEAFGHLRDNPTAREALVRALVALEEGMQTGSRLNIREKVTGPIVDAMYRHGDEVIRTTQDGLSFICGYTSKIVRDLIMSDDAVPDHVWEPMTTRFVLDFARTARNILVGGAFFGDHCLPMAKTMTGRGTVHAFELSDQNAGFLRRNLARNAIDNVIVNQVGLWSTGNVRLALKGDDSHASPYVVDDPRMGFAATSIDAYGQEKDIDALDLILLDIEGGEIEALKGAAHYLAMPAGKAPVVCFEVHASYVDWSNGLHNSDICKLMSAHGYTTYALRDYNSNTRMAGFPVELVALDGLYLEGPPHGFNCVAAKDVSVFRNLGYAFRKGISPKLIKHGDPTYHAPIA
jgi:FkbM family methyltransferase